VSQESLRAPFPYFGGKKRAAPMVWEALGDVANYVEPFCGSAAVMLGRPHEPRVETVNDFDCMISNFWRATAADPDGVAEHCDWPVIESDLSARHQYLVDMIRREWRERMTREPYLFDAKVAGWWVWGLCAWIGDGWCRVPEDANKDVPRIIPHLSGDGQGVHRKMPNISSGGVGVHSAAVIDDPSVIITDGDLRVVAIGGAGDVPTRLPHMGGERGVHSDWAAGDKRGVDSSRERAALTEVFARLKRRLRRVRVACGDWQRVLTPTLTWKRGVPTGVFLDPPYGEGSMDYSVGGNADVSITSQVRDWAIEHGEDPRFRIVLAGYEGQHDMPASWRVVEWKAQGGYGGGKGNEADANSYRERLWCSPHCQGARQASLFETMGPRVLPAERERARQEGWVGREPQATDQAVEPIAEPIVARREGDVNT